MRERRRLCWKRSSTISSTSWIVSCGMLPATVGIPLLCTAAVHAQEAANSPNQIGLVCFCKVKIENDSNFKKRGERAEGEGLHLVGMAGNGQGSIDTQLERYIDAGVHQAKAKFCSIGPYMTSKSSKFCKDPAGDGQKRTGGGG